MWFAGLVRLALGGFLFGSSACRAAPPSPPKPVHLSVGFADTGLYNRDTGIAVLVSQLEDERLIRLSADGRFEPALAERWEQSPDGLAWTFFLRRGLTFHNGMPLDAQAATARLRQPIVSGSSPGFRDVLSVEARGPLELVIRLRRPSRFVLDALAVQSIRSSGPNSAGAGPFRATSQQKDRASLSAFSGYYRGKPAISQVDIRPYRDGRNAWSALMRGEIDFLFEVSPDALDFVKGSSATQVKSFIRQHLYTLGFNMRHPVLRERAVRVALSEAVNRDEIVKVQFGGRGAAATSMLWPKHWAYDAHLPMFGYAPMDAGRLLDAAGLVVKPAVDRRMPSRFRFTCLLPESDARFERMALMLQRQFIEVGVDMQLEPVSMGTLVQRLGTGQYEAFLFEVLAMTSTGYTRSGTRRKEAPPR